tara:strand:- start:549 stop:1232 length:684 start_codon:yes stop_codon:yes gene_type:complete
MIFPCICNVMSTSTDIKNEIIWEVWEWCSEAYIRYGRKLMFPANTDPTKTYQWRYVKSIAKKFEEWEFDEVTSRRFINIAIERSRTLKIMHKGLAALHQGNLLDVCYKILQEESSDNSQLICSLADSKKWVASHVDGKGTIEVLLDKSNPDAFCNLVKWYQASKLSELYLSLSKSCGRAIKRVNGDEVEMLPSATRLYKIRNKFYQDVSNQKRSKEILGKDCKVSCR